MKFIRSSAAQVVVLVTLLAGVATACPPPAPAAAAGCISSKLDPGTRWFTWDGQLGPEAHYRRYSNASCTAEVSHPGATFTSPLPPVPAGIDSWYAATWSQILANAVSAESNSAVQKCADLLGVPGHLNSGGTFVIDGHPEWFLTSVPVIFDMTAPNAAIREDLWLCSIADGSNGFAPVLP